MLTNAQTISADLAKASSQVQGTMDGITRAVANFETLGKKRQPDARQGRQDC